MKKYADMKITIIFLSVILVSFLYSSAQNKHGLSVAYNVAVKDSSGKSNYEIFVVDTDGNNAQNITRHPDVAWTYKAYQQTLYFISDRDTCYRCYFLY